jgi:predicted MFS family arabinose efflux permease
MATKNSVLSFGNFELWFIAHLTFGLVYVGGAMFLLPPFTLSLQGATPGDVGIVMAVLPLIALGAPLVGGLLDRFGSFRLLQFLGLGLFALGFGVLALADELIATTFGALLLGVGAALVLTTNMSLMAASGLPDEELNGRMSLLQMSMPLGQFLGLVVVAVLLLLNLNFNGIFIAMAVIAVVGLIITALTAGPAEKRALKARESAARESAEAKVAEEESTSMGLGAVLLSSFGLVLLVVLVSMAAHSTIESQYANFMTNVFNIDGEISAIALAVAVLISVPIFPVVGRWLANAPYRLPLLIGIGLRAVAGLGLWLIADAAGLPALAPLLLYGVIMVVIPLTDVSGALLAANTSPIGPGGGQGGNGFALAGAAVLGAFIGGWAAEELGFAVLGLVVGILAAIGFVLALFVPDLRAEGSS